MKNTAPLRRYRRPRYPTRLEVLSDPELLKRNLPPAWRTVPELAGAVTLCLAVNTATCSAQRGPSGSTNGVAIVAPLFEHGEGRGAVGCVVVAPPVFLSEEEAWQVIDEELSRQGVKASDKKFEVRGVRIPKRTERWDPRGEEPEPKVTDQPGTAAPFKADRADPKSKVVVEFVSQQEYHTLGGARSMSTVQAYDLKGLAKSLASQVKSNAKDKAYFGILYDPAAKPDRKPPRSGMTAEDWRKQYDEARKTSKAESQRLLRLQVQDFVKWLQGQGVI
jgi:hypothetical protein